MNVMALLDWTTWVVLIVDPRSWVIAAVSVFAWRPFVWQRRLLVALLVYLLLAVLIELVSGTLFGPKLYSQFFIGLVATALWFGVLQRVRRAFFEKR